MKKYSIFTIVCMAGILVLATVAQATTLTNMTTGSLIFADDYEGVSAVSSALFPDASGDYNPVAQVGSWRAPDPSGQQTQVTDYATPGAAEGDNYLRMMRTPFGDNSGWAPAYGVPTATQETPGEHIQFETMFSLDALATDAPSIGIYGPNVGTLAYIIPYADGRIDCRWLVDGTTDNWGDPIGVLHNPGQWNHLVVDYITGEGTYLVTVNGQTAEPIPTWYGTGDGVEEFRLAANVNSQVNFDAVPEPSALMLLVTGFAALTAFTNGKHK